MTYKKTDYVNASTSTPGITSRDVLHKQAHRPPDEEPPRKPDWLLILVGILFLLTLLIAWLADIPTLFR
ncbi:hypothetical protein [Spirosoma luteum]|uniref:hypothetical protein n=1 Tax=Spirosoma luteum TaxID=431553 RepID=UPI00036F32A2|nr:hypothetical protein [Spirosoma luteum]